MVRTIELGGYPQKLALVDDADYDIARRYNWTIMYGRYTYYARRSVRNPDGSQRTVLLHRYLTNAPKGTEVHHVNDDGLDCRRENMIVGTASFNRIHMIRTEGAQYTGVHRSDSTTPKWYAQIQYEGERFHLGTHDTPEAAAQAYVAKWNEIVQRVMDREERRVKQEALSDG